MSKLILTGRDIEFFKYLHAVKVATIRQANRDVFMRNHKTCYLRLRKFLKRKFLTVTNTDWKIDRSFTLSLTNKGMKIITSNMRSLVDGKRFKSNSIDHDLKLVDIRKILVGKNMVKEYYCENQIQTYGIFNSDDELVRFKRMRVDALLGVQAQGKAKIYIPLELEISVKSTAEYQKKIREIYYYKDLKYLFYVCFDTSSMNKLKKIEQEFASNQTKKILYVTYAELLASSDAVIFTNQDNQSFKLV